MRVFIPFDHDTGGERAPIVPFDRKAMHPMAGLTLGEMSDGICEVEFRLPLQGDAESSFRGETRYGCGSGTGKTDL